MFRIIRIDTTVEKVYTYFLIDDLSAWDDFLGIRKVLTDKMKCELICNYDNLIYMRYAELALDNFKFCLAYYDEIGNYLYSIKKQDEPYYLHLEGIANTLIDHLNEMYRKLQLKLKQDAKQVKSGDSIPDD